VSKGILFVGAIAVVGIAFVVGGGITNVTPAQRQAASFATANRVSVSTQQGEAQAAVDRNTAAVMADARQATAVTANATATAHTIVAQADRQRVEATAQAVAIMAQSERQDVAATALASNSLATANAINADYAVAQATATAIGLVLIQDKEKSMATFWEFFRIISLAGFGLGLYLAYNVGSKLLWRRVQRPDVALDADGNPIAYRSDFTAVRQRTIVPPATQRQPQRNGRPVFVQNQNTATRANLTPMTSEEATAVSSWLNAVAFTTAEFNRDGAAVYNIGHPRADGIIDLAVSSGYASKDGGRSAPVIPARNFVEFQDMLFSNQSQNS